jgi:hypothetical protein
MRDWKALVERSLEGLGLEPEETTEVAGDWRVWRSKILAAKRNEQIMQKRVRQLWVPGFLSLILCLLFQAALLRLGLQPRIVWSGSNSPILYLPWLAALPFIGALAAYVSSRAGGSRGTALFVSVFPTLALTGAFLLMFPIGLAIEGITGSQGDFSIVATVLLKDGIGWILVPGTALLLGGLLAHLLSSARSSSRYPAIG